MLKSFNHRMQNGQILKFIKNNQKKKKKNPEKRTIKMFSAN